VTKHNDVPDDVLHFISRRIDTVPHLEALLLLWEQPQVDWTEEQIAARVYVSHERARSILAALLSNGLISLSPTAANHYRYNSAWDQNGLMEKVATSYRQHLVHVAGLIHAKAASDAVKHFARAFEFKKKE